MIRMAYLTADRPGRMMTLQQRPGRTGPRKGTMARCEDAPCCGCGGECGTPLGGTPDYGYYDGEPDPDEFYDREDDGECDGDCGNPRCIECGDDGPTRDDGPGGEDAFLDSYMEDMMSGGGGDY